MFFFREMYYLLDYLITLNRMDVLLITSNQSIDSKNEVTFRHKKKKKEKNAKIHHIYRFGKFIISFVAYRPLNGSQFYLFIISVSL